MAQHHEVAGLLANSGGASPAGLWDGIAGRLDEVSPPAWEGLAGRLVVGEDGPSGDGAAVIPLSASRRRGRSPAAVAVSVVAAAAAVLAIVLGMQVHHLDNRVSALQGRGQLTTAEQAALTEPSTRRVSLAPGPGAVPPSVTNGKVTVVLTSSGTGFVEGSRLSALPADKTYQLWGVINGQTISLGLLGRSPGVVPFSVAGGSSVDAFAITAEHAGGVVHSTNQPVVAGEVTA